MSGAAVPEVEVAAEPPVPDPEETPLEWSDNPWRRHPLGAALGAVLPLALVGAAAPLAPDRLVLLALAACLWGAWSAAFLPAAYRVDAAGVHRRRLLARRDLAWEAIRRGRLVAVPGIRTRGAAPKTHWLVLSTRTRPGRLDAFRDLTLVVPRDLDGHDALVRELRHRLARHGL